MDSNLGTKVLSFDGKYSYLFSNFTFLKVIDMRFKLFLVVVLAIVLFQACKEDKKVEEKPNKMELVLEIHDEVMPKMGTIGQLIAQLKPMADSTQTATAYENAIRDLEDSNKSMMEWMNGFGNKFDSDEILNNKELSPEKIKWLDEEEIKVKELRTKINTSIQQAEQLLNKEGAN
jgi:hypothetical protein